MISLKEITEQYVSCPKEEGLFPLTQTFVYGLIQRQMGRKIKYFEIMDNGLSIGSILVVEYPLFGNITYWYAPYGPVLYKVTSEVLSDIKSKMSQIAKGSGVAFVRFDFSFDRAPTDVSLETYFRKSPLCSTSGAYFQPRNEWFTSIDKTPEEILSSMHPKTRYSVRLAEKKGVSTFITQTQLEGRLPVFLNLMKQTSIRNGFSLHNEDYYKHYFREVEKIGNAFLIEGIYEGEVLATHFVIIVGDVAHYVFGASSDAHKDLCAPYLVHFRAMLKAKEMGAKYYNFGAVTTGSENKKWQGLSVFKQKFGGQVFAHGSLYDLVLKPFWYYMYIARKLIKKYI